MDKPTYTFGPMLCVRGHTVSIVIKVMNGYWQVPCGSTAIFMVLRYHGITVISTVLVLWKRSTEYRGTA